MDLVKSVVREPGVPQTSDFTAWIENSKFMAEITGIPEVVAEVGAQLAWLGAALRSSPLDSGLARCIPKIVNIRKAESGVTFGINFSFIEGEGLSNKQWHKMFRNLVVVENYPISLRAEPATFIGLEIPLPMMAMLVGEGRVSEFCGKVVIKGFSAMLVAEPSEGTLLVWNYMYDADGSRIHYPLDFEWDIQTVKAIAARKLAAQKVIAQIKGLRHIV